MRVRGKGATLVGAEGSCPPLQFIEVEDAEAARLIDLKLAVSAEESEAVQTVEAPADTASGGVEPATPAEDPVAKPAQGQVEATQPQSAGDRQAEIIEAIELLSDDDYVKSGARAERPKVEPLRSVLGWPDLTVSEVDAAFAAMSSPPAEE